MNMKARMQSFFNKIDIMAELLKNLDVYLESKCASMANKVKEITMAWESMKAKIMEP